MTGWVLSTTAIAILLLVDGACSGFRAVQGRDGLVRHGRRDRRAAAHGVVLACLLLLPALPLYAVLLPGHRAELRRAQAAGLLIIGPYAVGVASALLVHLLLPWRMRYLAMALVLGPCTLVRPWIAVLAGLLASLAAPRPGVLLLIWLVVGAALAVEPLLGRSGTQRCAGHER